MARKVLISFVGTGPITVTNNQEHRATREYRKTKYVFEKDKDRETAFVAEALSDFYEIDDIIMIGTVRSMWEEVYRAFCEKNKRPFDESYYWELASHCENANHNSELELPEIQKLESALGKNSHVVLVEYGLKSAEISDNISKVLNLNGYLNSGDELYIDVTHSFRSLPLIMMNTLIYLQNVSSKNIKIKKFLYGMYSDELKYAPIVDMTQVLDVNNWIIGAYNFREFGNAYKIADLLDSIDKGASQILRDFSDANNLNNIYGLEKQIQRLRSIKFDSMPDIAKMTIAPVINDYLNHFDNYSKNSKFQLELAKWHAGKHRYSSAYLTLVESIITYVCEQNMLNYTDKEERETAKRKLMTNSDFRDLKSIYNNVNSVRKGIAHALSTTSAKSNQQYIRILEESISEIEKIYAD